MLNLPPGSPKSRRRRPIAESGESGDPLGPPPPPEKADGPGARTPDEE
jgi:hypothetical protein